MGEENKWKAGSNKRATKMSFRGSWRSVITSCKLWPIYIFVWGQNCIIPWNNLRGKNQEGVIDTPDVNRSTRTTE